LVLDKDDPVGLPSSTIVVGIGVSVFVKKRCVVEIRVRGDGKSTKPGALVKSDGCRIELGRPEVGIHL
jgi:hypothetical protein